MKKYAKIQIYKEDELDNEVYEPLTLENISVVLESEFLDEAEEGDVIKITVVEMSEEDYDAISVANGY